MGQPICEGNFTANISVDLLRLHITTHTKYFIPWHNIITQCHTMILSTLLMIYCFTQGIMFLCYEMKQNWIWSPGGQKTYGTKSTPS